MARKAEEELAVTLNPTSLLHTNQSMKHWMGLQDKRHGGPHDSILSNNPSATADFNAFATKNNVTAPYQHAFQNQ